MLLPLLLLAAALTRAHILLTYPGTRGNNLITNKTFPFGMQWDYPCGGIPTTRNRTYWPTTGGAVAFQPGWFQGHAFADIHINLGLGTHGPDNGPPNMSLIMMPALKILGPSNTPYPGTVCFPQVPTPVNLTIKPGDLGTIQIVENAQHGAALYACVDIIFAEPGDPRIAEINESNCFNSQTIGFADIYTITTKQPVGNSIHATSDGTETVTFWFFHRHRSVSVVRWMAVWLPVFAVGVWVFF